MSGTFDESEQGPFIKERQNIAQGAADKAEEYYREYWDVERVFDLEKFEPPEEFGERTAIHYLDYAGIDKLVVAKNKFIFVAQRFRADCNGNDFSLQFSNGTSKPSEYKKYTTAIESEGNYPNVYAFGNMTPEGDDFEEFVLIDMERFLKLHVNGELDGERPYDPNGTSGIYFPLVKLHRNNCILQSWGTPWKEDSYNHPLDGYEGPSPFES